MPLEDGAVFAGYAIVQRLGSGPVGDVYLARHPRLPGHFALKVASETTSADRGFCARFIRQAVLAARISHPNLVGVHDFGEFEDRPWVTMDYVEGDDAGGLAARSYQDGMPEHDVCVIITAVAAALDYLHQGGYWHRGVKPTNILLTEPRSGDRRILLSDFMTGRLANDMDFGELTATSRPIGTLAYAAPEAFLSQDSDYGVDQYSLAATAFHLLTGAPPFWDYDLGTFVSQLMGSPPPRPSDRRPQLAHLDQVLATGLAKNPADRFARCGDFAEEVARASGKA